MWTFKSEIERISNERAEAAAKEAAREAAREGYLTAQKEHEQKLIAATKSLLKRGMNFDDIADVLGITQAEVAKYTAD